MREIRGIDRIVLCLTVVYFAASFLMYAYTFSKWIMAASAVVIVLLSAWQTRGKLRFQIEKFHIFTVAFCIYCYLSTLWARNAGLTIQVSFIILQTLTLLFLIYLYYQRIPLNNLLMVAMLGGYAVCIVALAAQGLDTYLTGIMRSIRIYDQEYINANRMGMVAASSIVLNFYYFIHEKKIRWWTLLAIPALICIAGAASKKSIILLVGGCFLLVVLHNLNNKKVMRSLIRIFFFVFLFVVAVVLLSRLSMFSMVLGRFDGLINFITGKGTVDVSTQLREEMIKLGFQLFRRSPLVGFGINNPQIFNTTFKTSGVYLHNNFVELLAGGGILGFVLYYSMYAYVLYNLWKYRAYRTGEFDICLSLLLVRLALEFAHVAYYSKEAYFYFMIFFLEIKNLKKQESIQHKTQEV